MLKCALFHFIAACLALLALPLSAQPVSQPVSFGLFGDTPYSHWEREQLPDMLAAMGREGLAFVVHDGDIKSGSDVCSDEVLLDILGVFQASKVPLIYVPGDNDWTDCHRPNNGRYDPMERLAKLRELFYADENALGQRKMALERQSRAPAFSIYRENVRWQAGGVLFVGMNLPGSSNNFHGANRTGGPVAEYLARSAANRVWLQQAFALAREKKLAGLMIVIQGNPGLEAASTRHTKLGYGDFLDQLREETTAFAGQVVLVHGDTHLQQIDQPLLDVTGKQWVKNFTRVETYGYPFMGWIKATVDVTDPQVFKFSPRRWGGTPYSN